MKMDIKALYLRLMGGAPTVCDSVAAPTLESHRPGIFICSN
ncbi:hypothetical protein RK21_04371 [Pseudomonas plecoglossicida]|nr:hypothetical protein RK21_04371 [Pseudomonas plecoglossicida]